MTQHPRSADTPQPPVPTHRFTYTGRAATTVTAIAAPAADLASRGNRGEVDPTNPLDR